ncbi:unnamed protein product [Cochlearia groenlandica]
MPVSWQSSLRSSTTKQDVKPPLVSPSSSSTKASRSPLFSQKTSRNMAKETARDVTKISSSSTESSKSSGSFILMVELRKKIITFRGIIDLPPLTGYLSVTNMVMRTMKDLNKLCPEIVDSSRIIDMSRDNVDKLLEQFYNALKSIGDPWIDDDEWLKSKDNSLKKKKLSDQLVEKVIAALDGLIKGMNERLSVTENNNDEKKIKVSTPRGKAPSYRSEPDKKQPVTPTPRAVQKAQSKSGGFAISVSNLPENVRMNVKLSPIDLKRLAIQNACHIEAQRNNVDGEKSETEKVQKMEKAKEEALVVEEGSVKKVSEKTETVAKSVAPTPLPQPLPMATGKEHAALPSPPSEAAGKVTASPSPPPPVAAALLPPPQLPMAAEKGPVVPPPSPPGAASVLPPPPLTKSGGKGPAFPPLPPPGAAGLPPPPPLPMGGVKGPGAPPPPPPGLRAKKAISKLKRSSHIGELYRYLKAKIEGKDPAARSRGACVVRKLGNAPASGKQGMADALAEIAKRSPYYQQIEADVQMYMKAINELKTEITKFHSKNITDLQKFHRYVESVLEKLTDETQVLARCEGFPQSKLEAIRMANALYTKLHGIIKELKNWKIESPADQLFDKTERYFAKVRKEIETLDQVKGDEEKKFKSQNIHFDFNILIQIKELMVDISSACIELALKEKREAKTTSHASESSKANLSMTKNKPAGLAKMLWRAFQFAFRVYTFAGGHDDRADKLTRELSDEIKLVLGNQ